MNFTRQKWFPRTGFEYVLTRLSLSAQFMLVKTEIKGWKHPMFPKLNTKTNPGAYTCAILRHKTL